MASLIVVPIEEIVRWRKEIKCLPESRTIIDQVKHNYTPSVRHGRSNHKRRSNLVFPTSIDETLGIPTQQNSTQENTLKPIMMALNRLSNGNVDSILKDLDKISVGSTEIMKRIAHILLHKTTVEKNFRSDYINLIDKLKWVVDDHEGGVRYSIKCCFLMELQKMFEEIETLSKDEGCQVMHTIGVVHNDTEWLTQEVFDRSVSFLLNQGGNHSIEYVIAFLKSSPMYAKKDETIKKITQLGKLPMRLKMILESL